MSTQKFVTTEGVNPLGKKMQMRQYSKRSQQASEIYHKLGLREAPFREIKIYGIQGPYPDAHTPPPATITRLPP